MGITGPVARSQFSSRPGTDWLTLASRLKPLVLSVIVPIGLLIAVSSCRPPYGTELIRASDWPWVGMLLGLMVWPFCVFADARSAVVSTRGAYLPTLDGWRALAIMLVIGDHTTRGICDSHHASYPMALLQGQHGVNLFFAISGLLITWKLLEEREHTGHISLKAFYRRRVYRILPAAFVYLSAIATLALTGVISVERFALATPVLYLRNFFPGSPSSVVTGHFWSLSIEEQFYLALPALLLLLGTRWFQSLAVVLISACAAWRWWFFQFIMPPQAPLPVRFRTDIRIDGLLCGCLMAIVLSDRRAREMVSRFLCTPVWLAVLATTVFVVYRSQEYTTLPESVLFPLLLAGTLLAPLKFPGRLLETAPLRWIGRISYSLYLWQQLFLLVRSDHWLIAHLQRFPANLIATFACAVLSHYLVERPMLRRAHERSKPPLAADAALAPSTA